MKNVSQTYLLTLTTREFECVTLAIMLNSNKTGKLQGLGRCISKWLHQWDADELPIIEPSSRQYSERQPGHAHQIYVGLAASATNLFRAWRAALAEESAMPVTVTIAITALVERVIAHHGGETA